jgi:choline-glycine betaine transporter
MSEQIGIGILSVIKKMLAAIVRVALFIIGWCLKLISRIVEKVGDEILRLSEK